MSGFNRDLTSVVHQRTVNRCNDERIAATISIAHLLEALEEFQKRERRYGGIREGQPTAEKPTRVAGE